MKKTIYSVLQNKLSYVPLAIFILLTAWWINIHTREVSSTENLRQLWAAIYQVMALYGAGIGILISNYWGGRKSTFGKSILFFSLGLLLQSFGQSSYSYYIFFEKIEVPYPSVGDIGFFGSVLAYIAGIIYLARVSGYISDNTSE